MSLLSALCVFLFACGGARADLGYPTRVAAPANVAVHPRVVIDEAHHNVHTRAGKYAPFARLLASDGYDVRSSRAAFTAHSLAGTSVLVIANARGKPSKADPAFTEAECAAVQAWVEAGGALLLVTDHAPIGNAAKRLADRFGVVMGLGEVHDSQHAAVGSSDPAQLVFARRDGLLGAHPILDGRGPTERIERVMTFTGQSLRGPAGSVPLLILSPTAVDLPVEKIEFEPGFFSDTLRTTFGEPVPTTGSQALALTYGRGRVVVTGEAAMLTAQILDGERFGMNSPGTDNRQLTLNIVHWLSGVLP